MTDIDYTQFKIVGVVEAQPNTKHAIINAVGYLGSDWKFTPLSPTEAKQVFPSRGRVFAPGFQDRYKELIGKCIFAGMMPSTMMVRTNLFGTEKMVCQTNMALLSSMG